MHFSVALLEPVAANESLKRYVWPKCKALLIAGHKLELVVKPLEDAVKDRQRRYLHGVVFKQISLQVTPGGVRHSLETWKEYFREMFLGDVSVTIINPMTGESRTTLQRVSSESLGSRAYARYIDRVIAYATTDLGAYIPGPGEIDPETGEIIEGHNQNGKRNGTPGN